MIPIFQGLSPAPPAARPTGPASPASALRATIGLITVILILLFSHPVLGGTISEAPFVRSTAPVLVRRVLPAGARTFLYATSGNYRLHGYALGASAWLDVYAANGARQHLALGEFSPAKGQETVLLWLEPRQKRGPLLVVQRGTEELLAVAFPNGFNGKGYAQYWASPEAATYSYNYDLGPLDDRGYRTIEVTYNEMGADGASVILRRWTGDRFSEK